MKYNKGFVVPLLLAIITLLVIGVGVYFYQNKKAKAPIVDTNTQPQPTSYQAYGYNYKGESCEKIIPVNSIKFKIGDRIQTKYLGAVRISPTGTSVDVNKVVQPIGSIGVIKEGPLIVSLEGDCSAWWKIDFNTEPDGWVDQNIL